jgi:hypothetical protein
MSDDKKIYFPIMDIFKRGTGNTLLLFTQEELSIITHWIKSGVGIRHSTNTSVSAPKFYMHAAYGLNLHIDGDTRNQNDYAYPYLDIGSVSVPTFVQFLNSMPHNACLFTTHNLKENGINIPGRFILSETMDFTLLHNSKKLNLSKTTITL